VNKVIIYSEKRIKGLKGRYIAPYFFKKEQLKGVEKVYTDDEKILKLCKEMKISHEKITKTKSNTKKTETEANKTNTKKTETEANKKAE